MSAIIGFLGALTDLSYKLRGSIYVEVTWDSFIASQND